MQAAARPFVIPVFIPHAGCPHRCIFCDQTRTTGGAAILPTEKQFQDTVDRFLRFRRDPGRFTEIAFFGGNFLGQVPAEVHRLLSMAEPYVRRGSVQGIRFSTRPDTVDEPRMALIRGFAVSTIELGVQTMDDGLLEISRRGHTAAQVVRAVQRIRELSCRLGLQMMVGLPGETGAAALDSARQIALLHPDFVRIYPLLVLEGSPLSRWYRQKRYFPLSLEAAVGRVKELYLLFRRQGIAVIRMGLQPTAELNADSGVLAGPFHPAFGELVHTAVWRDVLQRALGRLDPGERNPMIRLHPRILSRVKGHRNCNVAFLMRGGHLKGLDFQTDHSLPPDTIYVDEEPWTPGDH